MRKSSLIAALFLGMLAFTQHISGLAKAAISPTRDKTCQEIIDCIIDNADNILKNLHPSENQFAAGNQKLVYQLAKQCGATKGKIVSMIHAINAESGLRPNNDIVKNYFIERLTTGTVKNETLYEESVPLENEDFNGQLYVEGYKAGVDLKALSVVSTSRDNNFAPGGPLEGLRDEWNKMSGRAAPEDWWFSKDGVFFSYGFTQRKEGRLVNGLLILEKPLDYHTILEDCTQ